MTSYLRNAWYVAAWEQEIEGDGILARTLLDMPRILFRKADGRGYVMLLDRCPHRFAPLHMGSRNGDAIACLYHGLQFGPDGACVHNPFSSILPPHACVESTPVVARHGLLWFWPGAPDKADPSSIPDFSFLDGQDVWRRRSRFDANYELLADNLMDLSHVDFLHRKTFNTTGPQPDSVHEVRGAEGNTLWNTWLIPRVRKHPELESLFADHETVDQLTEMRWDAPASMMLRLSWMPAGGTVGDARFSMINPHIITPETASSSHYFWTCAPNKDAEAFAIAVFDREDKPMIEGVQARMGSADFWDMKPVILPGDVGAVRARRRLMRLRRQELGETLPQDAADREIPGVD